MKRCPKCNRDYTDDNDFCFDDGTRLIDTASAFNTPTQVFQTPVPTSFQPPAKPASPMLYLLVGLLAAGLLAAMIFIYVMQSRNDEGKREGTTGRANSSNQEAEPDPQSRPAVNSNDLAAATPQPVSATVSPNGNWSGNINYPSGSAFSGKASFSDNGTGQVSGQILWTLLRTANPEKMHLVGSSGTEFVRGTFDPATRTLSVAGYETDDRTGALIILDRYRLTVASDGRSLSGFSHGGKSRGRVNLRK